MRGNNRGTILSLCLLQFLNDSRQGANLSGLLGDHWAGDDYTSQFVFNVSILHLMVYEI